MGNARSGKKKAFRMKEYTSRDQFSNGHSFRNSQHIKRTAERNRAYSRSEKLRRGCEISGLKFPPEELEWHHPGERRFPIGRGYKRSERVFREELSRCICIHKILHSALHNVMRQHERIQPR